MILLIAFSFIAGVITILSPCILPILPIILTSTIGGQKISKARPLGVVAGFIFSFTFFTLFLSSIVKISGVSANTLRFFSIAVLAIFGLTLIIPQIQLLTEKIFSKLSKFTPSSQNKTGFEGGILIGLSIGLLWTPCVGPILASVISLAITGSVTLDAFFITFSYALGTSIPMLLIMIGGQNTLRRIPWLVSKLGKVQKTFGVVMILTAIALYFNIDRKFQSYILNAFPQYGVGLTSFEDNSLVRNQLNKNSAEDNSLLNQIEIGKPMISILEPKGKKAPEIISGGSWFNSDPLTLKDLRGKVVVIDFWTYSCINCQRTLPYLRSWYEKYKEKGLVIIGVHSPEFEFEKNEANVTQAIKDFQLTYPIVQDNNFSTWKAYSNRFWPAKYFIDKEGYVRFRHFGDGAYNESEQVIQELLKEAGAGDITTGIDKPDYEVRTKTPESYLGYGRLARFASPERIKQNALQNYSLPKKLGYNELAYEGNWIVTEEYANPQTGAKLYLNFDAKEVYLVMRNKNGQAQSKVYVDDKLQYFGGDNNQGTVTVLEDTLYHLVTLPNPGEHTLKLEFLDSNTEVYAFTFG